MSQELDQLNRTATEAVTALREAKEKFGADSAEFKNAMVKTESALDKHEKANQEITKQIQESKSALSAQADRIAEMEVTIARGLKSQGDNYKSSPEYKAMDHYLRTGSDLELKVLRGDSNVDGGYLVEHEMSTRILKELVETSPIRQLANVMTVSKKTIEMPKRTSVPIAEFEGELEESPIGQPAYANEQLTAHRLAITVQITRDLLMDAGYDFESNLNADIAEAFALAEGRAFVLGNGIKRPEGFLANPTNVANAATSSTSGVLKADDLLALTGQLKAGYNGTFVFNRQTLAQIRAMKGTTNDHYIWQASLGDRAPATIGGDPYVIVPDMPNVAAGALAVAFADFKRGYQIIDRTGMTVIRDEYTGARRALVSFTFAKWTHGQVVMPEAFKLLRIAA